MLPRRSARCYRLSIRSDSGDRRGRRNGIRCVGEACGQCDGNGGDPGGNSIGSSGGGLIGRRRRYEKMHYRSKWSEGGGSCHHIDRTCVMTMMRMGMVEMGSRR
mmetsp:Transcript_13984/g.16471  ORF Transcript_13984/g.16471 Transcript_13984/m.16471 type:complete len:104 (+) Transcript_13984:314-625(+)